IQRDFPSARAQRVRQQGHRTQVDGTGKEAFRLFDPLSVRPVRGAGHQPVTSLTQKNRTVGIRAALFGLAMLGLAFAAVPLYRVFCQVTGFGGTTMKADAAPGAVAGQIGVRFDANIDPRLPWKFVPGQETVRIHPGARTTIYYDATNYTARSTSGQAIFNVTPESAGKYFS